MVKRIIIFVIVVLMSLATYLFFNHEFSADTVLYEISKIDGQTLTSSQETIVLDTTPNTTGIIEIHFKPSPSKIYYDDVEIPTNKVYKTEMYFNSGTSSYSFELRAESGVLSDSIDYITYYGAVPLIELSDGEIVDSDPNNPTELNKKYLHLTFNTKQMIMGSNSLQVEFPTEVTPDLDSVFFTNPDLEYIYDPESNILLLENQNLNTGIYIPISLGSVVNAKFVVSGSYVSSVDLKSGTIQSTDVEYKNGVTTISPSYESYAGNAGNVSFDQEVSVVGKADPFKFQYTDLDHVASTDDPYVQGFDFTSMYTLKSTDNIMYSNFQFDTKSPFSLSIPYNQISEYGSFDIYLTDASGIDIFSNYKMDDFYKSGGVSPYTNDLQSNGYSSMMVSFNQSGYTYTYTDKSGSTMAGGYEFNQDLTSGLYLYTFNFDPESGSVSIQIDYIDENEELDVYPALDSDAILANRNNNKLETIGEPLVIDFSTYGFTPDSFVFVSEDSKDDILYLPITTGTRLFSSVTFTSAPYQYPTASKVSDMPSDDTVLKNAGPMVVNYNNGVEVSREDLYTTSLSPNLKVVDHKLPNSSENAYNSSVKSSGGYHLLLESSQVINGEIVTRQVPYNFYVGTKAPYQTRITVTSPVNYPVGIYLPPNEYTGFTNTTDLNKYKGSSYKFEKDISEHTTLYNIGNFDYTTEGTYTVYYRSEYPNPDTGELMYTVISQSVVVAEPSMDFGDLPKSFGDAGAVGTASKTYQIGINLDPNDQSYIDKEFYPYYSANADGDDKYGINDEFGWLNMPPTGTVGVNYTADKIRFSVPYTAGSTSTVCMWMDINGNGVFETLGGKCKTVLPSKDGSFSTVELDYNMDLVRDYLSPNDQMAMRIRILRGRSLYQWSAATTYTGEVGETEDFMINIYGPSVPSEICIDTAVETPTLIIKNVSYISEGIIITADIPSVYAPGSVYTNATITITSSGNISFDAKHGGAAFITFANPGEIKFSLRDSSGNPINAPLTVSFWGLSNGEYITNTSPTLLGSYKPDYLSQGHDKVGVLTTDYSDDVVSGGQFHYTVPPSTPANPSSALWLNPDVYFASDFSFYTDADTMYIGLGYNSDKLQKPIDDCIQYFNPNAVLKVFDETVTEGKIYTNYPFDYVSEGVAIPYYKNLESVTAVFEIPDGASFVDGDSAVEVYRRPFYSNVSAGGEWELVDPSHYTQTISEPTQAQKDAGISKISKVEFDNKGSEVSYGYEYKFIYHMQIDEEYLYTTNPDGTSTVKTGVPIEFQTYLYFDKADSISLDTGKPITSLNGFNYAADEAFYLNPVHVTVLEPFNTTIDTTMGQEEIIINTDGSDVWYTLEYNNCDTCVGVSTKTPLPKGVNTINVPIPDPSLVDFPSSDPIDMYEDMTLTLYDNDFKVAEVNLKRWYPTESEIVVSSASDLEEFNDGLNPTQQQVMVMLGRKSYIEEYYSREVIDVKVPSENLVVENGQLNLDYKFSVDTSPDYSGTNWSFISDDQIRAFKNPELYSDDKNINAELLLPTDVLDPTLNVEKELIPEVSNDTFGKIMLDFNVSSSSDTNIYNYVPVLDSRYVIEKHSGRIYDTKDINDCVDQSVCTQGFNYSVPTDDLNMTYLGYNDVNDEDLVIADSLPGQMLLYDDPDLLGKSYPYVLTVHDFGLNESTVKFEFSFDYDKNMVSYKQSNGKYYFKRDNVTDEEKACIEADACGSDYRELFSGTIRSTAGVRNEIMSDKIYVNDGYSNNLWLDEYYQ